MSDAPTSPTHTLTAFVMACAATLAVPAPAAAQATTTAFIGLDIFAGGIGYYRYVPIPSAEPDKEPDEVGKFGWNAGATVSYGTRWFGLTGTVGHHTIENVPTFQAALGPSFTAGRNSLLRVYGHVLVGIAHASGPVPPQSSKMWGLGIGLDFAFVRLQSERVHLDVTGLRRDNVRVFVGAVVPLCLRGCREQDIFNVSGRKPAK